MGIAMSNTRTAILMIVSSALMAATPYAYGETKVSINSRSCSIESQYNLGRYGQAYVFKREQGSVKHVAIGGGQVYLDGKRAALNAADQQRVIQMENQMRLLTPQAQDIAREAIDIAFVALTETAKGIAPEDKSLASTLEKARTHSQKQVPNITLLVDEKVDDNTKGDVVSAIIEPVIIEYVPKITGAAISTALGLALGGEAKAKEFEQRMQAMEKTLEQKVEARAKALEPKAEAFCSGMTQLDDIENRLEFRTKDGKNLELFSVSKD
jgi:hypothetical protein